MKTLPVDYLKECFAYDSESGQLWWKERPRSHFSTEGAWKKTNVERAGKPAGYVNGVTGRLSVKVNDINLLVHRVAFVIYHGKWPVKQVDHWDGNFVNNRIHNLREATSGQNSRNRKLHSNNKSGYTGVVVRGSKWLAQICVDRKVMHLGMFNTPEEAYSAYRRAAEQHHGEFAASNRR